MTKAKEKRIVQKRMYLMLAACLFLLIGLIIRTGYLQIVRGSEFQKKALAQQTRDVIVSSKRGSILDRNGKGLAVSASVETVTAAPSELKANSGKVAVEKVAQGLSEILELDYDTLYARLTKNSLYEILKRKIEKEEADRVRGFIAENEVIGVRLTADVKRFYPYGSLAAHVIGFTGLENQGLEGIEMVFDKYLKGSPGRIVSSKNAAGTGMNFKYETMVDPEDGTNLVLTIDESIQRFVEKHLETALHENKLAKGAAAIVIDPNTGEILAMSTKPDFDLNAPFTLNSDEIRAQVEALTGDEKSERNVAELQKMWRNKAVSDSYEAGSTFKMFTAAMALEENVVSLNDRFYCSGSKKVATHNMRCWKHGGHGSQTFVEGVQNSCNPVFIEVGARVGTENFRKYYEGFGFTQKTGVELPGESQGVFYKAGGFNEVELATSSFGQGPVVTPLQMIAAAGAIANGGKLMRPHLVKRLVDNDGNVVQEYEPEVIRQIISEQTSKTLSGILETVVSHGTGSGAYIKGFRVGGKTGTSEKLPRGNQKYIASFAGFAPSDNPQLVCIVILDEPTTGLYYGGQIATPVVRAIMEDSLNYLGIEPAYTPEEKATLETAVPNLVGKTPQEAKNILTNSALKHRVEGGGETILNQIPKAGVKVNQQSTILLYTEEQKKELSATVPNALQKTPAEAAAAVSRAGLNINITGTGANPNEGGYVSFKQDPPAGESVPAGEVVTVEFRRIEAGE